MVRTPQVAALYARLSRQVGGLSTDRVEALESYMESGIADEQTAGIEGQLRERIAELLAGGDTLAAIAGRSGLHASPFYRWWRGDQSLHLRSFAGLCRAVGLRLSATVAERLGEELAANHGEHKKGRAAR